MTLYFAYGSNLNKRQMKWRCPNARPICPFILKDARLVFRNVADVIYEPGSTCMGAIWRITPECEKELDRYEGIASGHYLKVYFDLEEPIEGDTKVMVYIMNSVGVMPPAQSYLDGIREGYRNFGLPLKPLDDAVEASHDNENPSHVERTRYRRKGRPELAERPSAKKQPKKVRQLKLNLPIIKNAMIVYGD